ncbi:unnamed protein product [Rotaria sordida]|uniref:Uncharacterized protein n=1 Tax=Rotaria sordida TaxID=392033 RepID=A0A814USY8_9BILA|nr:unnamed protein product [Rotaria sordida]CAF1177458.1 unnamed protein product [Rotaria sordida]
MVDVLYSFVDVNRRFNRLAFDSLYIRDLNLTNIMTINSLYDQTSSVDIQVLSRIFEKVLCQIHHRVYKLTVEGYSMKQILRTANYPQLYSLSLLNFEEKILYQYLRDDLILRHLLTKQITHLNIDIKKTKNSCSKTSSKIFALILSLCKKLIVLNFGDMFLKRKYFGTCFYLLWKRYIPSTLVKLKINVATLTDCLYLLDGPLVCLSTLIINVEQTFHPFGDIDPAKKLPKLKCFSFTMFHITFDYDILIVPLLCRMINLEELKLYLTVGRFNSIYIDGIQFYDQFLMYMTQLNKFTFNIRTDVYNKNVDVELQSNEDIQRSFIGRGYQQVTSYVHSKSSKYDGECRIYSLPYDFEYFVDLNNSFQGGMFDKVRQLNMCDGISFEHKLFKLLSQDFPCLEFLCISNNAQQKDKQDSSTLITFPYLTFLDLQYAYVDYAELFLLEKNMHLPRLINLRMEYQSLTTITNNFINDATHFNFSKLKSLDVCQPFVRPKNFHQYFPLLYELFQ